MCACLGWEWLSQLSVCVVGMPRVCLSRLAVTAVCVCCRHATCVAVSAGYAVTAVSAAATSAVSRVKAPVAIGRRTPTDIDTSSRAGSATATDANGQGTSVAAAAAVAKHLTAHCHTVDTLSAAMHPGFFYQFLSCQFFKFFSR